MLDRTDIDLLLNNPGMRVLLIVLSVMVVQALLRASTDRIVERVVRGHRYTSKQEEHQREETLKKVFGTSSAIFLWIVGTILILWSLDVNIAGLLTGAGLISVVVGLSAQSVIKDYLAGMFIIIENQYRVDDIITLAAPTATVSGVVEDISIRMTRLRDLDGNLHIVSNGQIGVITNQDKRFAADTLEPIKFLRVDALNESNVTIKALGKVRPGTQWDVCGEFRRQLKDLFAKHDIAVPYASAVVNAPKDVKTKKK